MRKTELSDQWTDAQRHNDDCRQRRCRSQAEQRRHSNKRNSESRPRALSVVIAS